MAYSTISFVSESYIKWESAVNAFICYKSPTRVRNLDSSFVAAGVAAQLLTGVAPLRVGLARNAAYGCAVFQLGVSDLLQFDSVPRVRSTFSKRGPNSLDYSA